MFWLVFSVWLFSEYRAWKGRRSQGVRNARDRGSLALLTLCNWGALGLAFGLALQLPQAAIAWGGDALFILGVAGMLGGVALRWYAMRLLGRFFTYDVEVQAGQKVIEAGPYRLVRHPSYSGAVMSFVGLALALGNWAALLGVLAVTAVGYSYRIRVEEKALVEGLGPAYADYMRRTRRLIPYVF